MFQKFGKYVLLEKIATGGMAEIWLAKQSGVKGFEKLVVIKKILPQFNTNEKFTKMFINEAKIASKLNHPNIVQIYDLGNQNNIFYIVMEYVPGYDLLTIIKQSIKAKRRLPLNYAVKIISQSANALYYANNFRDINTQKLNIVHRDISPQNILVSYDGIAKVVDFGIAKASSSDNITKTGVLKGKYPYMSPEQILGKRLDGRSDIFSLAVVLYEITVGKRLFKANSELMTLKKITEEKILSPREVHPKFPQKLNDIIMKALARNRAQRYNSAKEFSSDLENYLTETQKNISTMNISKWLKEIFKDDIIKRILNNKRLFNKADIFLEKAELDKIELDKKAIVEKNPSQIDNNINEFEFDKNISTDDLKLTFEEFNKDYTDSKLKDKENLSNELEKEILNNKNNSKDELVTKGKSIINKIILFIVTVLSLYLLLFGGILYYNVYSSNRILEEDLTNSVNSNLPGKEMDAKLKLFCKKDNILCDKDSIKIIELKNSLNLSIKYKIRKKLFNLIPIELDYNKKLKREINN